MPYGGGIFVPSETAYKDPNRFKDVLQAEGNKEASYLASMDQFYSQLDEAKRQFDVTAEMKDRQFEETVAFNREKLDWQSEENALDRSSKENIAGMQADLLGKQLDIEGQKSAAASSLNERKFSETQDINEFYRKLYGNEEERKQSSFDALMNTVGRGSSPSTGILGAEPDYYNPVTADIWNSESGSNADGEATPSIEEYFWER